MRVAFNKHRIKVTDQYKVDDQLVLAFSLEDFSMMSKVFDC